MSATTEPRVKKEKSSKKRKSTDASNEPAEPILKKEKSSRKRKSTDAEDDTIDSPMELEKTVSIRSKKESKSEEVNQDLEISDAATAEVVPEVIDDEILPEGPPSKKRKASVAEIEVDITLPEPPSKKALRRLKKGKPLPPSKSGADSSPEPDTEKAKKPEVEKRSEHGIWIGNLPWSVSKTDLRKFFTDNSDITDEIITRVNMPGPNDSKPANKVQESKFGKKENNKGFAYVDFSTAEAVEQAVELSEQLLAGRRVLIKNNKSYEGRPLKTKEETRAEGKPPNKKIFVGNLRFDTTKESLTEHFERCGPIETIMVASFEDTGKCKGYGWITFEELEAAKRAVAGYVFMKQEEEDDEDSESDDAGDNSDEESPVAKMKSNKLVMRKVYIDKIQGRPVRREYAEDAQVRYKKRYGKDGTKSQNSGGNEDRPETVGTVAVREVEYRTAYAPRLTGGIVKSQGKKVVF